jgi:dTDP-4-amino-4,6-dideoxygalactose transaminase
MLSVFGSQVGVEELNGVQECLEANWLGAGKKVVAFEKVFEERLGQGFTMLNSATSGLQMALRLLNLKSGSEVILPSFTWISCAHVVLLEGLVPVFCDVDLSTMNTTWDLIEAHITPRTGAIMIVHYAGLPVRMDEVMEGASHWSLPVIEDAAHAVDSCLKGKLCGTLGTVGVYSFDAMKNIATPDAGGITTSNPEWNRRAKVLRYLGIEKSGLEASVTRDRWWEYNIAEVFPRCLSNDVAASIGLAQYKKLPRMQEKRKSLWDLYQRELEPVMPIVRPVDPLQDEQHSYFTYCVRAVNGRRDQLAKYLYDRDVYTVLRYHPLHLNSIYKSDKHLPNCERLSEEGLSLPIHPRMTMEDVLKVIDGIKGWDKNG